MKVFVSYFIRVFFNVFLLKFIFQVKFSSFIGKMSENKERKEMYLLVYFKLITQTINQLGELDKKQSFQSLHISI